MSRLYSLNEIKIYLESQDSLGDIHYNLNEENVDKAIWEDKFQKIKEEIMEDDEGRSEDDLMREVEEIFEKKYKFNFYKKYY